jgi:hypothetical protein
MRTVYKVFLVALVSLALVQCQKDLSYVGSGEPSVVVPEPLTANLQGNILDENDQPAAGVTITAGAKTAITDANGYFHISQASLDSKSAVVTATKTGYFKAFRSFDATSGTNQVTIKLIKKNITGTVSATAGGDVALSNGTKINLKAGTVVDATTGATYTGTVNVYASYIDPTASDIAERVPGSFMANNIQGSRVILSSFGMVAVELESATGDKLQVKSGSTATLTMAIPASLQSAAPATIPMWHLDEQTGIWQEEGSATKTGNTYVAEVKHFSFWNCDQQFPAITLSLTIKNADSLPLVHVAVSITRTLSNGSTATTYGFTDSLGHVSGLVPKNETLHLIILGPCGAVAYSQNVGPFSQNTNLGIIYIPASNPNVITVKGKLLTCANTPVMNGYALIQFGNMVRYTPTDSLGRYHTSFVVCNATTAITIMGVDVFAQLHSANQTFPPTLPVTNVPDIIACGSTPPPPPPPPGSEYINYQVDSMSSTGYSVSISSNNAYDSLLLYTTQSAGTNGFTTYINGIKNVVAVPANQQSISFKFNSPSQAPGSYTMFNLLVNNIPATTSMSVNVSPFPLVIGQIMEGSFSGTFATTQPTAQTHTIMGTFRLIKRF